MPLMSAAELIPRPSGHGRRRAPYLACAVYVGPVVDAHDMYGAGGFVDAVDDPVGAAPRGVVPG
jgi:hypothetical protein